MSENVSESVLDAELSSANVSPSSSELECFLPSPGCWIFLAFTAMVLVLLLPLCVAVLHHGLRQRRDQRSTSATTSHSDSFTYHLVTMELCYVIGCVLCCCGIYINNSQMLTVWYYLFSFTWYGETFFQLLTCMEHYLAVVHPVTYLRLREAKWIRVRDVAIGCIWLLCISWTSLMAVGNSYMVLDVCLLIISVIIITFCSLSVLRALIRPGPGDQGRDQVRVDQSKRRAFYAIAAILGVLVVRCVVNLVWSVQSVLNGWINDCVSIISEVWISLPGSLVLPLLYLHKAGMFARGKNNQVR